MKKLLLKSFVTVVVTLFALPSMAQKIEGPSYIEAYYSASSFKEPKYSGTYGIGMMVNTRINLGMSFRARMNYGIMPGGYFIMDLGPQYTICFTERFHLNIPAHVSMYIPPVSGKYYSPDTLWAFNMTPSFQYMIGKLILKAGVTFDVPFKGGDPTFGFLTGLGISLF